MPQVDEVLELPFAHGGLQWRARRKLAAELRDRFDVAYICPNSLKSALLPWWARIPKRIGYRGETRLGLLTQSLPNPKRGQRPPMVAFYSALSGESDLGKDVPSLQLGPLQEAATLAQLELQQRAYYVFAPGAEYGPAKRWPPGHFAELALQMELPVVLLGSGKEAALCAQIAHTINTQKPGACVDLAGRTSLDQALAVIAGARAMVSNDSGLMHVAAAFALPQVALFGSSSPLHTPPLNARAQVLWLKNDGNYQPPLTCAPCFERVCPLGHTRCLVDLKPGQVLRYL
jgi:heptosyltransferase-2